MSYDLICFTDAGAPGAAGFERVETSLAYQLAPMVVLVEQFPIDCEDTGAAYGEGPRRFGEIIPSLKQCRLRRLKRTAASSVDVDAVKRLMLLLEFSMQYRQSVALAIAGRSCD